MIRICKRIARDLFMLFYSPYCRLVKGFTLNPRARIDMRTSISKGCIIHSGNVINNTKIGYGSYLGLDNLLPNTIIGKYCCLAHNIQLICATHPTSGFVSFHPAFYSTLKQSGFTYTSRQRFNEHLYIDQARKVACQIGNDVWIGSNVIILGGVTIGDGSMVAAGSVVTRNVEPYSMVGGVPANLIKYRFNEEQRDFLMNFKWWDKDPDWLKKNVDLFENIDTFKENLDENS